jgi:hypothetical protein
MSDWPPSGSGGPYHLEDHHHLLMAECVWAAVRRCRLCCLKVGVERVVAVGSVEAEGRAVVGVIW